MKDKQIKKLIEEEKKRQKKVINLNTNLEPVQLKALFDIRIEIDPKSKQSTQKGILSLYQSNDVAEIQF